MLLEAPTRENLHHMPWHKNRGVVSRYIAGHSLLLQLSLDSFVVAEVVAEVVVVMVVEAVVGVLVVNM